MQNQISQDMNVLRIPEQYLKFGTALLRGAGWEDLSCKLSSMTSALNNDISEVESVQLGSFFNYYE